MVEYNGAYYFISDGAKALANVSCWVSQTNGLVPEGTYRFGADAQAIMTTEIVNEDGTLYYYLEGKRTADKGVVKIGDSYYYVGSGAICPASTTMWIDITNDLLPQVLKSINDFNPKLPSYSTTALVRFLVFTIISGTTTCSFPNPIDILGTR